MTASKTRKKHQQELIHSALMAEETSKRVARENFTISNVQMLQMASFEPLLHQPRDEEEEGENETNCEFSFVLSNFDVCFQFITMTIVLLKRVFRFVKLKEHFHRLLALQFFSLSKCSKTKKRSKVAHRVKTTTKILTNFSKFWVFFVFSFSSGS